MQKEKKSTHMTEKRNKHMTLEDRIEIQTCLRSGMTFKAIARRIGKDPTTVSREVKARSAPHRSGFSTLEEACPLLLKAPFRLQWLRQTQPCQLPLCPAAIHSKGGALMIGMIVKLILSL